MIHLCPDELLLATPLLTIGRWLLPWVIVRRLRQRACRHRHMLRERDDAGVYHVRCLKCGYVTRLMTPMEYRG